MKLNNIIAEEIRQQLLESLKPYFSALNSDPAHPPIDTLEGMQNLLNTRRDENYAAPDAFFDEIFVLEKYLLLARCYGVFWQEIYNGKFSSSWITLQHCFDQIRLIKKFSTLNIEALEEQLIEIEKIYPYDIFLSSGMIVDKFECSICGNDIDSFDCTHRRGHLYRGKLAIAIAKNISNLDHVAIVEKPVDKRCVIQYNDNSEVFRIIRSLREMLHKREIKILSIGKFYIFDYEKDNENYIKQGRNEICKCGSGKKHKYCCDMKSRIKCQHVQVFSSPAPIDKSLLN